VDLDTHSLLLILSGLLLVGLLGCVPSAIRVIRIRRFERRLGKAFWPLLVGIDTRNSRLPQLPRDDG
jgi:hypothetical protein